MYTGKTCHELHVNFVYQMWTIYISSQEKGKARKTLILLTLTQHTLSELIAQTTKAAQYSNHVTQAENKTDQNPKGASYPEDSYA